MPKRNSSNTRRGAGRKACNTDAHLQYSRLAEGLHNVADNRQKGYGSNHIADLQELAEHTIRNMIDMGQQMTSVRNVLNTFLTTGISSWRRLMAVSYR